MPATVVVGAQWGDEGKGKIVDLLAQQSDLGCRYQGGPNAGHTIVAENTQVREFDRHEVADPDALLAQHEGMKQDAAPPPQAADDDADELLKSLGM